MPSCGVSARGCTQPGHGQRLLPTAASCYAPDPNPHLAASGTSVYRPAPCPGVAGPPSGASATGLSCALGPDASPMHDWLSPQARDEQRPESFPALGQLMVQGWTQTCGQSHVTGGLRPIEKGTSLPLHISCLYTQCPWVTFWSPHLSQCPHAVSAGLVVTLGRGRPAYLGCQVLP